MMGREGLCPGLASVICGEYGQLFRLSNSEGA
jgi:hypothetical protein